MRHYIWYTDIIGELVQVERHLSTARGLAEQDDEDDNLFPNLNVPLVYFREEIQRLAQAARELEWSEEELPASLRDDFRRVMGGTNDER